uniref:uncharacterized protein LOC100177781 isoform X1 n=1 Tax=Ciona intestinalis TaxID=7719 RepID=UPI00089DB2FB|nr:uncharacterized protein LOC100177781 isoform X1 [Ciona intestinalis]|eukprot:XP_018672573.1 uncharacterized protein LOC100177781 isoform X1 [Ciona intestinalis]
MQYDADHKPPRPRSLMILPTPKLISLEEAQARSRSGVPAPTSDSHNSSLSSESGVKLRESSDRHSSTDRRKRSQKKPLPAFISSTPKIIRKQVHGSTHASIHHPPTDITHSPDTPSHHTPGWKVKLGSLLRKSNNANVIRQSSLRRTQSDDSLVSSGSQQKLSENLMTLGNIRSSLSHATSCEQEGLSDRLFPEPQVRHPNAPTSGPSPVPMRSRGPDNRRHAHQNQPRPTGVYTDDHHEFKSPDTFQIKFKQVKLRHSKDPSPATEVIRSSSPFSGLASDFPGVMGEGGLGFDPLNYRPAAMISPQADVMTPTTRTPDNIKTWSSSDETSPPGGMHRTISIKRVSSVQSLHAEPMFAAVSMISSLQNVGDCGSNDQRDGKVLQSLPETPEENVTEKKWRSHDLLETKKSPGLDKTKSSLDGLTAEDCFSETSSSKVTKLVSRKTSAAQLLGVVPYRSTQVDNNTVVNGRSLHLDLNENIKQAETLNAQRQEDNKDTNERRCIQYHTHSEPGLTKKPHYGSLIALVGLKTESQPGSAHGGYIDQNQQTYTHTRHASINEHSYGYNRPYSNRHNFSKHRSSAKSSSTYKHSPPKFEYRQDDTVFRSPNTVMYVESSSTRIYTARLDTFNPEGRQRNDYCEYSPPKNPHPSTYHSRSQSVDAYKPCHNKLTPGCKQPRGDNIQPPQPLPAPRKHYRSYSAGDDLQSPQPSYKPTPLPRNRGSIENRPFPLTPVSNPMFHPWNPTPRLPQ